MHRWLKFSLLGLILVVLFLMVALVTAALRPHWLVSGINASQSAVQVQGHQADMSSTLPILRWQRLELILPGQHITLEQVSLALSVTDWLSNNPFWSLDIEKVALAPRPGAPAESAPAPAESAPPDPAAIVSGLPPQLLRFKQINIRQLQILNAAGEPVQQGTLALASQSDTEPRIVQGTAEWSQADLSARLQGQFTLDSAAVPFAADVDVELGAARQVEGRLAGTLSFSNELELAIAESPSLITLQMEGLAHQVTVNTLELAWAQDQLRVEQLEAEYQQSPVPPKDQPAAVAVSLSGAVTELAGSPRVVLNAEFEQQDLPSALKLDAQLQPESSEVSGFVDLRSDGLPDFVPIAPLQPAQLYPLAVAARFSVAADEFGVEDLVVDSPSQIFSGEMNVSPQAPLRVLARIDAERLTVPLVEDGTDLEPEAQPDTQPDTQPGTQTGTLTDTESRLDSDGLAQSPAAVSGSGDAPAQAAKVDQQAPIFSQQPIAWAALREADIDVQVNAAQLFLQQAEFKDFQLALVGQEGELTLAPLTGVLGEGGFDGRARLALAEVEEGAPDQGKLSLDFNMQDISLQVFGLVPEEELSGGDLLSRINLAAEGATLHDLAASLQGEIVLMMEAATLANDFVELVGSDVLMETMNKLNPFYREDPTTEIECGLVRLTAEEGVLRSRNELVLETGKMQIVGDGQVNLNTEKLDVTFSPTAKAGVGVNVGSLVKFLKLGGDLRNPVPAVDALGVLQSGAAIGAALSTGGVSVVAEGLAKRVINAGSACSRIHAGNGDSAEPVPDVQ
ncbi:MAG: AsmA family protein [Pseudomonadota bacterium]